VPEDICYKQITNGLTNSVNDISNCDANNRSAGQKYFPKCGTRNCVRSVKRF
jgi:hypothetical protein